jgi:hypothetical protein
LLEVEETKGAEVHVELGDTELGHPAWGAAMPVDPGPGVVRATALGHRPFEQDLTFEEGKTITVKIPALAVDDSTGAWTQAVTPASAVPLDGSPTEPASSAQVAPPPREHAANAGRPAGSSSPAPKQGSSPTVVNDTGPSTRRIAAYTAGGVGVLGVAAGAALGLLAIRQKAESDKGCVGNTCSPDAYHLYQRAQDDALLSNVGLAVGGIGLAACAYLYFTEPSAESRSAAKSGPKSGPSPKEASSTGHMDRARWVALPIVLPEGALLRVRAAF